MSTLLNYFLQALSYVVNRGLFLKFWAGSGNNVSLYLVLVYIMCFFALVFIFKKFYRW